MSNNNQAIIMAVGVGAIGTLLAYVGYSMSQKENESIVDNKKTSFFDSIPFFDNNNSETNTIVNVDNDTSNNNVESIPLKNSTFFNFWKTPDNVEDEVLKDAVKASIEK